MLPKGEVSIDIAEYSASAMLTNAPLPLRNRFSVMVFICVQAAHSWSSAISIRPALYT